MTEALHEKLAGRGSAARASEPGWMRGFGELRRLRQETERIQERIEDAFEAVEPEDRA